MQRSVYAFENSCLAYGRIFVAYFTHTDKKTSQLEQDKQLLTFKLDLSSDLNLACLSERRVYQYRMLDQVIQ